jgi:hypothetical protein
MNRRNTLGTALVVLAVVLFVVPAVFPVQPVLIHDTDRSTRDSPSELREQGVPVVAYENLSERGQEAYVAALEREDYRVGQDAGAPDFRYPTSAERREAFEADNMSGTGMVVIERPEDDSDLPPADERFFGAREEEEAENDEQPEERREERRERVLRYDAMMTATGQPPLGSTRQLLRLGAVMLAVVSLGTGGYLLSSKG